MDAERYMNEIVDPTIKDFEDNPTSRRHAFLACLAVFHTVDYLANTIKDQSKEALRQSFCNHSKDFLLIDCIAHAFKHVKTGDKRNPKRPPFRTDNVIARPPAILDELTLDLSILNDFTGGITTIGEGDTDVLTAIKSSMEFLREKLQSNPNP